MINNSIYSRFLHCSRFRNKIATHGNLLSTASGTSYHHFHHAYDQEAGTSTGNVSSPRFLSFSTTATNTGGGGSSACNGSNGKSSSCRYPSNIKVTSNNFVAASTQARVPSKQKFGTTTTSLADLPSKHSEKTDVNVEQENQQQQQEHHVELRSVYVHQLSQLVLEYLQLYRHEWVVAQGLDQSLSINRDGSFELSGRNDTISYHYPLNSTSTVQSYVDDSNNLRIWTSYDEKEKKHWLTVRKGLSFRKQFLLQDNSVSFLSPWNNSYGGGTDGSSVSTVVANQGTGGASTMATAINKNKTAHLRNERIRVAVNEMIHAIDQLDEKKSA